MTDRTAMLAAIIAHREDDTPRLVMADWLEENGEPARAEFIRVQCELSRDFAEVNNQGIKDGITNTGRKRHPRFSELARRENELRSSVCERLEQGKWFPGWNGWSLSTDETFIARSTKKAGYVSRGFISSVSCSWQDWLTHSPALWWHPTQTEECPECRGGKIPRWRKFPCPCGIGRIPRPCPASAQPLEKLVLTDHPNDVHLDPTTSQFMFEIGPDLFRFDRVKCPCEVPFCCPNCNDQPLNLWTCERWPGLEIEMPQAERTEAALSARRLARMQESRMQDVLGVPLEWRSGHRV